MLVNRIIFLNNKVSVPIKSINKKGEIIIEILDTNVVKKINYLLLPGDRKVEIIKDLRELHKIADGELFCLLKEKNLIILCKGLSNTNSILNKRIGDRIILLMS
jgi:hypothetical protein